MKALGPEDRGELQDSRFSREVSMKIPNIIEIQLDLRLQNL
jgi:hypothetical protein